MALQQLKFEQNESSQKDIASLPDRPGDEGITAAQLKARFDQVEKTMVALGRYNNLIDELVAPTAAAQIGATVERMAQTTIGGVLSQMRSELDDRYQKSQSYDRSEVDQRDVQTLNAAKSYTDAAVFSSGAADMQRIIYDPQSRKTDIFAYADRKVEKVEGMGLSQYSFDDAAKQTIADCVLRSGDEMTGPLVAMAQADDATPQLRNIVVVDAATDLSTLTLPEGTILFVREE